MYQMVNNITVDFNRIFQSYPDFTKHLTMIERKKEQINDLNHELSAICLQIIESNVFDENHKWFDHLNKENIQNYSSNHTSQ